MLTQMCALHSMILSIKKSNSLLRIIQDTETHIRLRDSWTFEAEPTGSQLHSDFLRKLTWSKYNLSTRRQTLLDQSVSGLRLRKSYSFQIDVDDNKVLTSVLAQHACTYSLRSARLLGRRPRCCLTWKDSAHVHRDNYGAPSLFRLL